MMLKVTHLKKITFEHSFYCHIVNFCAFEFKNKEVVRFKDL